MCFNRRKCIVIHCVCVQVGRYQLEQSLHQVDAVAVMQRFATQRHMKISCFYKSTWLGKSEFTPGV